MQLILYIMLVVGMSVCLPCCTILDFEIYINIFALSLLMSRSTENMDGSS